MGEQGDTGPSGTAVSRAIPKANTITTLDSGTSGIGSVGTHTSVTIGADGLGLISYYNNSDLKAAHCDNLFCTPYFRRR
jgi:hypothetical protein